MDLAWLTARVDEDEQDALAMEPDTAVIHYPGAPPEGEVVTSTALRRHALREVEFKRAILDLAHQASAIEMQVDQEFATKPRDYEADPYIGDVILRALAKVYCEEAGYREAIS